jgi:vacuolar-type H+-ATPase subunit E/Vma4
MPYFNRDDVYRQFAKEINGKADEQIENLKKQIEETKEKNLRKIHNELKTSIFRNLDLELNEINADFSANLSRVKTEHTKDLMKKRRELLDSVTKEAKEKCLIFVSSPEYKELMAKKVKKTNKDFSKKSVEFRIKKGDDVISEVINKNFNGEYVIKEINEIEIGGFSAICYDMGIMIDETIDGKLREKQLWFYEHSDLAAK